ncbi:hypothetical protein TREMEDRAFT_73206 [Tremella mesenterica DSM 1558]|uniref:uncharacterized protein n=1 Tax=Tremella mesenterica (strain ATCC 24925 / CBS 8224 / DSM 1558 / NBRC 9311 / NRRL Y-6157 / RJB 2259-6 / UBC 559-6) TaxID=578456 RepID=UPI0003F494DB|nr:uncharacterized protein TREMEDRAFT_73206 [Tremella mesenterica DSM 1558]EIW71162.1 hypothetical protein TREMEDRAFT_73206 [Tremella mesenterica DSM 1558]
MNSSDPTFSSAGESSRLSARSARSAASIGSGASSGTSQSLPLPHTVPLAPPAPMPSEAEKFLPVRPVPDSLLLRSTFSSLEHSAATLKRLTKAALGAASVVRSLLEQLERAEDELFGALGELAQWLEVGYGVQGGVWDVNEGTRKVRKAKRRKEREELEVLVERNVAAVKGDLKRHGVANGAARVKFENVAKNFYHQTSLYLSPIPGSPTPTSQYASSPHLTPRRGSSDHAQAARLAQFDLARYNHHSTLLYAVPPSSVSCLDLLVSLYTWASSVLSDSTITSTEPLQFTPRLNGLSADTDKQSTSPHPNPTLLRLTLSESLSRLGSVRTDLLVAWGQREHQTTDLEHAVSSLIPHSYSDVSHLDPADDTFGTFSPPSAILSNHAIEHRRPKRIHKLQKSVGGRLRDLLNPSSSNLSLSQTSGDTPQRSSRMSLDSASFRPRMIDTPSFPPRLSTIEDSPTRPPLLNRRSLQGNGVNYTSPFFVNASAIEAKSVASGVGGVGGLDGRGDEDAEREQVGRKKEGVLWGAGSWEGLSKTGGKSKWEKFWVVLDHSRIYEYRDNGIEKPDSAHAVIDLKFASVREGRGTDRRFVFEVVTPTQGRRLYQATSEQEMKQWLYAICNAIESCINGTSSVRTFDASKLRTVSGSLDDHALPTRPKLGFPSIGLGTPVGRRSLPPQTPVEIRKRQTSLKKVLRQSAEIAGQQWNNVSQAVNSARSDSTALELPRPTFPQQHTRSPVQEEERLTPVSEPGHLSIGTGTSDGAGTSPSSRPSDRYSWYDMSVGEDIEKRVLEMAGLGLGTVGESPGRRVKSESLAHGSEGEGGVTRSRSEDLEHLGKSEKRVGDVGGTRSMEGREPDMKMLRAIAAEEGNSKCADCGKGMKSSRWATISLRDHPMVLFLCIRCVGIHRSLGTHISKPRSVDLDIWTPGSILLAAEWGNERGNAVWERRKPRDLIPSDDTMPEWIKRKYVEGIWLSEEDRIHFGVASRHSQIVSPRLHGHTHGSGHGAIT